MSNRTILPANATSLERALDQLTAQMETVAIDIRKLWNPQTCPVDLLPWLAWANSVDFWSAEWTEEEKRKTIANAFTVHKTKGTRAALEQAVSPLGFAVKIIEWFEESPAASPYTFRIQVIVRDKGINQALYTQLGRLIETYKNVRSQLSQLLVKGEVSDPSCLSVSFTAGSDITIYPYIGSDIVNSAEWYVAIGSQSTITVSVYSS